MKLGSQNTKSPVDRNVLQTRKTKQKRRRRGRVKSLKLTITSKLMGKVFFRNIFELINFKEGEGEGENEDENELLDRVESILEEYKTKFPQFGLNGDKNIWIVKPAGLSRGR